MFHIISPNLNVDFLKYSKPISWLFNGFVVLSVVLVFTKGINFGIDFTGGAEVQVAMPEGWDTQKVRGAIENGSLPGATVIKIEDSTRNEYLIKTQVTDDKSVNVGDQVTAIFSKSIEAGKFEVEKVDMVGPKAGEELRSSAIISLLFAALGIFIYVVFRFDMRFGPGVVRALIFDIISTIGAWILFGREFNLSTVAALLTIAGYSCNDTIIIYDRVRDMRKQFPNMDLHQLVNKAININLGRTILTTLTTNFVVVSLWLFGGPVLGDFALCMLIGFSVAIPSTIFVGTPLLLFMEERIMRAEQAKGAAKVDANPKHA